MKDEVRIGVVRVLVDVVDAARVEQRSSALDAVNLIAFGEKKLGEVCSVLAGDSCNQGSLQTMILLVFRGRLRSV
jgi:hypothetical protein